MNHYYSVLCLCLLFFISLLAAADFEDTVTYVNESQGCTVEVEKTANGTKFFIEKRSKQSKTQQVPIGLYWHEDKLKADIGGFCKAANVLTQERSYKISCEEEAETGSYMTDGKANLVFNSQKQLIAVSVRGRVKRWWGWQVDTKIECTELTVK